MSGNWPNPLQKALLIERFSEELSTISVRLKKVKAHLDLLDELSSQDLPPSSFFRAPIVYSWIKNIF